MDRGHEVVGEMPGTQERPPAAPGTIRTSDASLDLRPVEDPEKAAAAVRAALGLSPDETTETVLQEIGLYREHVEKVSETLGLHPHAGLKMVLGQTRAYMEQAGHWSDVVETLNMQAATVEDVFDLIRALQSRQLRDQDSMVRTATMEELEQARARRHAALSDVMTLWGQHRLGEEPSLEDLLGLSAWLADGDVQPMMEAMRVRGEVYNRAADGPDGARWTPGTTHG